VSEAPAPLGVSRRPLTSRLLRYALHLLLFVLTIRSTIYVGGPAYSATLMSILVAHEMGHYLMARYHGVPASLPFFIPIPLPPIGTMGAVISMRTDQATRNQLMDIGAAGPICGFIAAVPAMIIGVKLSPLVRIEPGTVNGFLGDSALSWAITKLFGPEQPEGYDLLAHPVLMAAWAGFVVTSINLLPIGQLDGGHVLFAWTPERSTIWFRRAFRIMVALTIVGALVHAPALVNEIGGDPGKHDVVPKVLLDLTRPLHRWFTFGFILITLLARWTGLRHPPVHDPDRPLTPLRRATAIACLVVFLLTFMPNPMWTESAA
jgi:membrane-associated protease RseP (regulator of RpoE activity)